MLLSLAANGLDVQMGGHCLFAGPGWANHPHRHPDYQEICWVLAGSGVFRHDGDRYPLAAGSCFVSEPDVVHEIVSETEDLRLFFMTFRKTAGAAETDTEADQIWEQYQHGHDIHCQVPGADGFWDLMQSAPYQQRIDFLMRALFLESMSSLSGADPRRRDDELRQRQVSDPVQQAMAYIRNHCHEAPSVAAIAQQVGLSERQLRRRFKAAFQCGLVDAINQARLDQARRLLLMQHSVSATAAAVGIASPAMFSRLFKQAYGCTPGQWQRQQVQVRDLRKTVFGDEPHK